MADDSFPSFLVKVLDERLSGKSFIYGEEMNKFDAGVYALISEKLSSESYPNASKWYDAVTKKLVSSFLEDAGWVGIGGQAASVEQSKEFIAEDDVVGETGKEEKAAEEREAAKASESDVWTLALGALVRDDNALAMLEEKVHTIEEMTGVLAARSRLAEEGDGFKRLLIMLWMRSADSEDRDMFKKKVRKYLGLRYKRNPHPPFFTKPYYVFGDF